MIAADVNEPIEAPRIVDCLSFSILVGSNV